MAIEDVPRVVGGAVFRDEGFHRDRGRHADPQHPPTYPPHPPHPPHACAWGYLLSPALRAGENILCGLGGCGSVANDLHPSK